MSLEMKNALTHPLTIQVAWTVFMWVIALIAMSLGVFMAWFLISAVAWGVFLSFKMLNQNHLEPERIP